jgi:2-haloacid dehalogenase
VLFTRLPLALKLAVSRLNALTRDAVISCQMIGVYKPNLEACLTAARWMGAAPHNILMVACHNFDLNAAQDVGFKTAFVYRRDEWGPAEPPDPTPNRTYDKVCADFAELAAKTEAHHTAGD